MPEVLQDANGVTFVVDEDDNLGLPGLDGEETPVVQPDAGAKAPVVVEEPAAPAAKAQPAGTPNPEEELISDEESEELEEDLDEFIAEMIKAQTQPLVAGRDRAITKMQADIAARDATLAQLQKDIRDAKLNGMPADERARMEAVYALDDRKAELDRYQAANDDMYLTLLRTAYVADKGEFGVTADALEGMTEAQMDAYANQVELEHWRAVANGTKQVKVPSAVKPTSAKAAPAPAPRKAPAGMSAPSDVGGSAAETRAPTGGVAEGTGMEAMARTMASQKWQTVRTPQ